MSGNKVNQPWRRQENIKEPTSGQYTLSGTNTPPHLQTPTRKPPGHIRGGSFLTPLHNSGDIASTSNSLFRTQPQPQTSTPTQGKQMSTDTSKILSMEQRHRALEEFAGATGSENERTLIHEIISHEKAHQTLELENERLRRKIEELSRIDSPRARRDRHDSIASYRSNKDEQENHTQKVQSLQRRITQSRNSPRTPFASASVALVPYNQGDSDEVQIGRTSSTNSMNTSGYKPSRMRGEVPEFIPSSQNSIDRSHKSSPMPDGRSEFLSPYAGQHSPGDAHGRYDTLSATKANIVTTDGLFSPKSQSQQLEKIAGGAFNSQSRTAISPREVSETSPPKIVFDGREYVLATAQNKPMTSSSLVRSPTTIVRSDLELANLHATALSESPGARFHPQDILGQGFGVPVTAVDFDAVYAFAEKFAKAFMSKPDPERDQEMPDATKKKLALFCEALTAQMILVCKETRYLLGMRLLLDYCAHRLWSHALLKGAHPAVDRCIEELERVPRGGDRTVAIHQLARTFYSVKGETAVLLHIQGKYNQHVSEMNYVVQPLVPRGTDGELLYEKLRIFIRDVMQVSCRFFMEPVEMNITFARVNKVFDAASWLNIDPLIKCDNPRELQAAKMRVKLGVTPTVVKRGGVGGSIKVEELVKGTVLLMP